MGKEKLIESWKSPAPEPEILKDFLRLRGRIFFYNLWKKKLIASSRAYHQSCIFGEESSHYIFGRRPDRKSTPGENSGSRPVCRLGGSPLSLWVFLFFVGCAGTGGDWNLQEWKMTDHQKTGGWNLRLRPSFSSPANSSPANSAIPVVQLIWL